MMKIKIIRKKEAVLAAAIIILNVLIFIWPPLFKIEYYTLHEFLFAIIIGLIVLQWDSIIFALYLVARKKRTLFISMFCWANIIMDFALFYFIKYGINESTEYQNLAILYGAKASFTVLPVLLAIVFFILRRIADLIIYLKEKKEA